jgi:hypothetical protein
MRVRILALQGREGVKKKLFLSFLVMGCFSAHAQAVKTPTNTLTNVAHCAIIEPPWQVQMKVSGNGMAPMDLSFNLSELGDSFSRTTLLDGSRFFVEVIRDVLPGKKGPALRVMASVGEAKVQKYVDTIRGSSEDVLILKTSDNQEVKIEVSGFFPVRNDKFCGGLR